MRPPGNIAIIGAGMAGLTAARVLADAGMSVTVFDKGRRPGGRLASRHVEGWVFNHGCQFFSIRDPGFAAAVQGVCAPWPTALTAGRFAGVPDMAAVARHLSAGLDVRRHAHVRALARRGDGWILQFDEGVEQAFEALVVAVPGPQAAALVAGLHAPFEAELQTIRLAPCWAVMLGFETPVRQANISAWPDGRWETWQGAGDAAVAWAARENSRPQAPAGPPALTLHFSAAWSAAHFDAQPQGVIDAALGGNWGFGGQKPIYAAAHRWRYALAARPLGAEFLWDEEAGLGFCGDWCIGGRLEAAYLSGRALGIRLTA